MTLSKSLFMRFHVEDHGTFEGTVLMLALLRVPSFAAQTKSFGQYLRFQRPFLAFIVLSKLKAAEINAK